MSSQRKETVPRPGFFLYSASGNTPPKKSVFLSGNVQRGGRGCNRKPKVLRYFFSPYFDQLLDIEWGVDHVPIVLRHFLSKYWEFWALKKLPHGCPKWADTKVTSQCPKMRGGCRPLLDNVQKKDAFLCLP